jgi:hypothetical protein
VTPTGFDNRKAPRVKIALALYFQVGGEGPVYPGRTKNFSETGTAFGANQPVQKHDLLNMELSLPGQMRPITLPGQVIDCRWLGERTDGFLYEIRTRFLSPSEDALYMIRQSLAPLVVRKEGGGGMVAALVEERNNARVEVGLEVRLREVDDKEVGRSMQQHLYMDFDALMHSKYLPHMALVLTENISTGGLKLTAPLHLADGNKLALELKLPGLDLPVRALAVVQWATGSDMPGHCTVGIRFLAVRKEDALAIEGFVIKRQRLQHEGGL